MSGKPLSSGRTPEEIIAELSLGWYMHAPRRIVHLRHFHDPKLERRLTPKKTAVRRHTRRKIKRKI